MTARGDDFDGGIVIRPNMDIRALGKVEVEGLCRIELEGARLIRRLRPVNQDVDRWLGGCPRTGCVYCVSASTKDARKDGAADGYAQRRRCG